MVILSKSQYPTLFARLVANSAVSEEQLEGSGCWTWKGKRKSGSANSYAGIGLRLGNKNIDYLAHRLMAVLSEAKDITTWWDLYLAMAELSISEMEVDHLCYNTLCVNPDHLEIIDGKTNLERRRDPGGWAKRTRESGTPVVGSETDSGMDSCSPETSSLAAG